MTFWRWLWPIGWVYRASYCWILSSGGRPRSWHRPRYALRGGLSGAGARATAARIAAPIEGGFCPTTRSAAIVPSGRGRKTLCLAVQHARVRGRARPRSGGRRQATEPLRPAPGARERCNTGASRWASSWRWSGAAGLHACQTPPGANQGARRRAARAGRGAPSLPRPGHALARGRRETRGGPGPGARRRPSARRARRRDIPRDERAGARHGRPHPLGFGEALPGARAASCGRGHGAQRRAGPWPIHGQAAAMAGARARAPVVVGAQALETRRALGSLRPETRRLTPGRCACGLGWCQAPRVVWRAPRSARGGALCHRARCALAARTAVWAGRSVGAMGPEPAGPSAGCPWHQSGAWCASSEGATEAHRPGAAALGAWLPRQGRWARAGARPACPLTGARA